MVLFCFGPEVAATETELEVTGLGVSDVTGLHRHGWISVVLLPTPLILVYVCTCGVHAHILIYTYVGKCACRCACLHVHLEVRCWHQVSSLVASHFIYLGRIS